MPIEWQKSQVPVKEWLYLREKIKAQQEAMTGGSEYIVPKSTWAKVESNVMAMLA